MKPVLFFLSFLAPTLALCQEAAAHTINLPDTLLERTIEVPRSLKQLPIEEVTVMDTLTSPYALIYKQYGIISIAVKGTKSWDVWSLLTEESASKQYSFERVQLDGKGAAELVVRTSENDGRGGLKSGWSSESRHVDIWNLDTRELYVSLETLNKHHSWSSEYASDTTSHAPAEKREMIKQSNQDKHSETEVQLVNRKILITSKGNRNGESELLEYNYVNGYFIRKK